MPDVWQDRAVGAGRDGDVEHAQGGVGAHALESGARGGARHHGEVAWRQVAVEEIDEDGIRVCVPVAALAEAVDERGREEARISRSGGGATGGGCLWGGGGGGEVDAVAGEVVLEVAPLPLEPRSLVVPWGVGREVREAYASGHRSRSGGEGGGG